MSLKLQIYAVKGALQHLLNMVDKPAQLLDNAVMMEFNFCHFCTGSTEPTVFLKKPFALSFNLLKSQPLCVSHDSQKKPMAIGKILDVTTNNCFWERQKCPEQHHIAPS